MSLRRAFALASCALAAGLPLRADDPPKASEPEPAPGQTETMPERTLKQIAERQNTLLEDAARQGKQLDEEGLRSQLQDLCHDYELLLRDSPKFAPGYAAYGYLLSKVGMDKEALGVLQKADRLDPNIPLVKNQIGNCLAETGRPLEAVAYFLAAIRLDPKEPLYHYQLGTLLHEAGPDFIRSGEWTRDSVEHAMHEAFRRAAELAPERIEFTYRYAESFYDVRDPDWDEALKLWSRLEEQAQTPVERETMRLQAANVLIRQGKLDHARALLAAVTLPALDAQKQKLVAQLPESAKK